MAHKTQVNTLLSSIGLLLRIQLNNSQIEDTHRIRKTFMPSLGMSPSQNLNEFTNPEVLQISSFKSL